MPSKKHPLPNLMRWLGRFEIVINVILLCMMALIVTMSLVDLAFIVYDAIVAPPYGRIGVNTLVGLFSDFLLVLIGVELLETVRTYIQDKTIHVEVIVAVGLVAITRKIIVLEPTHLEPLTMIGIAAIILSLSAAFWIVHKVARDNSEDRAEEEADEGSAR